MLNLIMVPLIMGCALAGTVGLIKVIKKISPERFELNENEEEKKENK